MRFSPDDRRRFEEKYIPEPNTGCWLWTAALNRYGYGHFMLRSPKRMERAHRVSYRMAGFNIPRGKMLLHSCDERSCVNPEHLSLGDQAANMRDCLARGRFCRGSRHHRAKFDEQDIISIRTGGQPTRELAARFGVSEGTIRDIRARRYWRHV